MKNTCEQRLSSNSGHFVSINIIFTVTRTHEVGFPCVVRKSNSAMAIIASVFYGCGLQKHGINDDVNAFHLKSLQV